VVSGLAVEAVSLSLGGHPVLDGVDLEVAPGESVALLGPSGSGKTSLLRVVAGLVRPSAGRVLWDGADLADVPVHRRGFGLVFQDAMLFPHLDVGANIAYGARGAGAQATVERLLALVDLPGFAERRVQTLSGGQAQRVALARALAPGPRLLLLDEPFGALDRDLRDRLGAEVRQLLADLGVAALHVTHDRTEAALVADEVRELVPGPRGATLR
jgi:thiamine transport system ATP-binding protein